MMSLRRRRPPGSQPDATSRPDLQPGGRGQRHEENAGWTVFSYLIAGMIAYGLIGWLVAALTHIAILIPLGVLAGLVIAIVGVFLRYGRA